MYIDLYVSFFCHISQYFILYDFLKSLLFLVKITIFLVGRMCTQDLRSDLGIKQNNEIQTDMAPTK